MFKPMLLAIAVLVSAGVVAAADVNQATRAQLEAIKGLGPGLAEAILEERRKGPFKDWGDLVGRVKGVGRGTAARLSGAGLSVGGATYPSASAPTK